MSYKTKEDVMTRVQEHYDAAVKLYGERVLGVFLQGSWNYGEDFCDENSDVDTKCIVLPTFEDFCLGKKPVSTTHILKSGEYLGKKPVSITHVLESGEHLDAKDLRLYIDCFKKQNINFVEILFTEFKIVNPLYESQWNRLVDAREQIGRYDIKRALNCMAGMCFEKDKALTHPYPTLIDKIEKYGYDGKQLSHCWRIYYFMKMYLMGASYENCLKLTMYPAERLTLQMIKRNQLKEIDVEWAKKKSKWLCEMSKDMKDTWCRDNLDYKYDKEVEALMNDVSVKCMELNFLNHLEKNGYCFCK
jgi:hypothetical protein